jgi:enamine deaminase RidA (YjgF/YER057c/UK114 family)
MEHITDPATAGFEDQWHFSHVVRSRGLLFLSGVTGTGTDGRVAEDPGEQFEQLFTHLRQYLNAAGASLGDVVEMTTYHVGLRTHLRAFTMVKDAYLPRPYPAWSAIGVSQLITPGALVELRAIAEDPAAAQPQLGKPASRSASPVQ